MTPHWMTRMCLCTFTPCSLSKAMVDLFSSDSIPPSVFLCPAFSEAGHTKLPLSFRPSVCPSEICYPQFLNYPLDNSETWLDCSLG